MEQAAIPMEVEPQPTVRAKFKLDHVTDYGAFKKFVFKAICADEIPENQRYHKWTPDGTLEMMVTNPVVFDRFEIGKAYYLDFTPTVTDVVTEAATTKKAA